MTKVEVLPWNRFNYGVASAGINHLGSILIVGTFPTRDHVERVCIQSAASRAEAFGVAFNPFNLTLVFTPTK